jgi:hypothetical protein
MSIITNLDRLSVFRLVPVDVLCIVDSFSQHISCLSGTVKWTFTRPMINIVQKSIPLALSENIFVFRQYVNVDDDDDDDDDGYNYADCMEEFRIYERCDIGAKDPKPFLRIPNTHRFAGLEVVLMGQKIFVIQRTEFKNRYRISVFDCRGVLDSSFEMKVTNFGQYGSQFCGYNNSLWIKKEFKNGKTCLQKHSTQGKLLCTFYFDCDFTHYCMDTNGHIYVSTNTKGEYINKYELGKLNIDVNEENPDSIRSIINIGPPVRTYSNNSVTNIVKLCYNTAADSLIFKSLNSTGLFELTLNNGQIRHIDNVPMNYGQQSMFVSPHGSVIFCNQNHVVCLH